VDVSKGGEKATLIFDEQTVKSAAPGVAPGPPGIHLPMIPGQGRPMTFPVQNGQPQFNRFFPQQPGQVAPAPPDNSQNPATAALQRRRVRGLIQSGQ
jgi:hypothetical protein